MNDPLQELKNVRGAYEKNLIEKRFEEQGRQSLVVNKLLNYISMIQKKLDNEHKNFFEYRAEINKVSGASKQIDILKALLYFLNKLHMVVHGMLKYLKDGARNFQAPLLKQMTNLNFIHIGLQQKIWGI